MLRVLLLCSSVVVGGCTFITSCPTGQGNNDNGTAGTKANAGAGGTQGNGGTSIAEGGDAPTGEWVNVTGNLAGLHSECGNMSYVTAKPDEDVLFAGVAANGLFRSEDGGGSWTAIPVTKGSDPISHRPSSMIFDPADANFVWESGNYGSHGGVYSSTDGAKTFTRLGDITHNELVSIDFTDPHRKTLLAGGHEQFQKLYKSTDEGTTWAQIGDTVPDAAAVSSFPLIINATTFLLGVGGYGAKQYGIYRSTDGGDSWDLATDLGGYTTPLVTPDGIIYWTSKDKGLAKSDDQGETWTQAVGPNLLLSIPPLALPDGRIASATEHAVVVSADGGKNWQSISPATPFTAAGLVYSAARKQFLIWHWDCGESVLDDAIMAYDFDYEAR